MEQTTTGTIQTSEIPNLSTSSTKSRSKRIVVSSVVIMIFYILTMPYLASMQSAYYDYQAFIVTMVGAGIAIFGALLSTILFSVYLAKPELSARTLPAMISGIVLMTGGAIYLFGWIWFLISFGSSYDGPVHQRVARGRFLAYFGEAFIVFSWSLVVGIDMISSYIQNKSALRVSMNSMVMIITSFFCALGHDMRICPESEQYVSCSPSDAHPVLVSGYCCLGVVAVIAMISVLLTNHTNTRCIGIFVLISLLISSLLVVFGLCMDGVGNYENLVIALIAKCVIVIGLSVVIGADLAFSHPQNKSYDTVHIQENQALHGV